MLRRTATARAPHRPAVPAAPERATPMPAAPVQRCGSVPEHPKADEMAGEGHEKSKNAPLMDIYGVLS